jgi:hypothetical protein
MNVILKKIINSPPGSAFPWLQAMPLFGLSHLLVFAFLDTYFWDDYIRGESKIVEAAQAKVAGFPPWRQFIEFSVFQNSAAAFHIVTPVCFVVAAFALHKVLRSNLPLSVPQINAITLLFLVLPVNSARVAMIDFYYSFSYMLFFVAWSLLVSNKRYLQLLALPIFWLSFGTSSLLPFFVIPLIHFGFLRFSSDQRLGLRRLITWGALGTMPVAFWIVRSQTFGANVREYYVPRPLGVIRGGIFVAFAVLFLTYGIVRKKWSMSENARPLLIGWGFLSLAFGASAYMAGGHLVDLSDWIISFVPNFSDWDSRHQLLLPLGFSLIIVGALSGPAADNGRALKSAGVTAFAVISVILNFTFSQEYYLDSLKQNEVIDQFSELEELKTNSNLMISDDAFRFNARGRVLRPYEWEAMLAKSAHGDKEFTVELTRFVRCDEFKPTLLLTVIGTNGRLESLLTRKLGIRVQAEKILPCG